MFGFSKKYAAVLKTNNNMPTGYLKTLWCFFGKPINPSSHIKPYIDVVLGRSRMMFIFDGKDEQRDAAFALSCHMAPLKFKEQDDNPYETDLLRDNAEDFIQSYAVVKDALYKAQKSSEDVQSLS